MTTLQDLNPGQRVHHRIYGPGTYLDPEPPSDRFVHGELRARVRFDRDNSRYPMSEAVYRHAWPEDLELLPTPGSPPAPGLLEGPLRTDEARSATLTMQPTYILDPTIYTRSTGPCSDVRALSQELLELAAQQETGDQTVLVRHASEVLEALDIRATDLQRRNDTQKAWLLELEQILGSTSEATRSGGLSGTRFWQPLRDAARAAVRTGTLSQEVLERFHRRSGGAVLVERVYSDEDEATYRLRGAITATDLVEALLNMLETAHRNDRTRKAQLTHLEGQYENSLKERKRLKDLSDGQGEALARISNAIGGPFGNPAGIANAVCERLQPTAPRFRRYGPHIFDDGDGGRLVVTARDQQTAEALLEQMNREAGTL